MNKREFDPISFALGMLASTGYLVARDFDRTIVDESLIECAPIPPLYSTV